MLKNYIKIAFRNILRNKLYSFLNIAGLAIGMAACVLILLWVSNELSYNSFNKNLDRIFLVAQTQHYQTIGDFTVEPTPMPLAQTLKLDYPEIRYATRYEYFFGKSLLTRGQTSFNERLNFADSSFFRIFTFHFIEGDPATALADPNSIVLTESTAKKLFGDEDPLGKELRLNEKVNVKVTGIIEDVPDNSDLQFDGLVPTYLLKAYGFGDAFESWNSNMITTYVLLRSAKEAHKLTQEISGLMKKVGNDPTAGKLFLFPFKDYHLHNLTEKGGKIEDVILFSIVALFILIIACINFMNLATARSARRATEVGIKKVVGATRLQIARQFFGESVLVTLISLVIALFLVEIFVPSFNEITGKSLSLFQMNLASIVSILLVTVVTGLLAGIYPSVFLSSLKPVSMLKKAGSDIPGRFSLRRILVVIQFAISIALIIGTSIVYMQMKYIQNKNLGMTLDNVVYFQPSDVLSKETARLEEQLKENANVLGVTSVSNLPISIYENGGGWSWEGMPANQNALVSDERCDYGYLKTFGVSLKEGRFFSREHPADDTSSVVINESFAKLIGKKSPVGMELSYGRPYRVIGVVRDFNFVNLHSRIGPLAVFYSPQSTLMCVRVNGTDLPETLDFIDRRCKSVDPGFVFNYHFVNKTFERMYASEQRLGKIIGAFSLLAVIIASFGLFGLASFAAEARTKEVGIRRVLGASVPGVILLLSRELIALVLVGNIIAWPVAYYFMQKWLQTFAYRIDMNLLLFILAAVVALIIAAITTGYQAVKAATTNPVESLRYE